LISQATTATTTHRHRRQVNSLWGLMLVALFSLVGCSNFVVDKTETIADKVWKDQEISFDFEIQDTTQAYDLVLYVTHDADFGYQNLYTLLTVKMPPPAETRVNQLSMQLSDEQGNWHGKCSGSTCTIPLAFMTKTKFQYVGKYSLSFKQHTRFEQIEGVEKMRLCISKSVK
jgi:gliding motility-associated lipoprotein GldH